MYRNTSGLLLCIVFSSLMVLGCHSPKFNTVLQEPKAECVLRFHKSEIMTTVLY